MIDFTNNTFKTNFHYLGKEQPEWKSYIKEEYSLSEMELGYLDRFTPIIEYYGFDESNLKDEMSEAKTQFISNYEVWDKELFLRHNPEYNAFIHSINEYINCIQRGKCIVAFQKDNTYFYWLKLPNEVETPNHQTMIISKFDIIQLELNLNSLQKSIVQYLSAEQADETSLVNSTSKQLEPIYTLNNNFDHVDSNKVINYFNSELVEPGYLSSSDLQKFMTLAFEKLEKPESKFVFKKSSAKKKIIGVFYNYYLNKASKPFGKKTKYVELLGEYFEGYSTKSILSNFAKSIY